METTMIVPAHDPAQPKLFRITTVRPWARPARFLKFYFGAELVPLVEQTIANLRGEIDQGKEDCWSCLELIRAHDDKTVFFIDVGLDENEEPVHPYDVGGGACCEHCSRLEPRALREQFTIALNKWRSREQHGARPRRGP
jgi:hypothetical protein